MRGLIALAVIVGVLAFVAGVCYEIGSFGHGRHCGICGECDVE